MGAEDFAYMLQAKPGAYCFIANGDGTHRDMGHGAGPCMLHNPSYDFNDDLIPLGATYWVRLAETLAGAGQSGLSQGTGRNAARMISITDAFSAHYAQARVKFLEAAATAGLAIESMPHPLPRRAG